MAEFDRVVEPGTDVVAILAGIAAGWAFHTRPAYGAAVRVGLVLDVEETPLSRAELEVLMAIAYFQPVTRGEIAAIRGRKEVRTEWLKRFLGVGWIDLRPRRATAGTPQTYVMTTAFLDHFDLASLEDLPDRDRFAAEGLLSSEDRLGGLIETVLESTPRPE